ncbi:MAG: DUF1311 domain-containing protein [Alphaproteobacteria bacterium]|nr:DUF1311 domain-containing protein [Alphaproteobacteria bacterium]MDE2041781.1 DUF1311 domain-containing protein [Alphaproteobacteria bacterium]MDE2340422.1 DUF1311 domain-containing protein [Alphaproteobacteria bacterium]
MDRNKSKAIIGGTALICLALGGCKNWLFDKNPADNASNVANIADAGAANGAASMSASDAQCASPATYDAIKKSVFDSARTKVQPGTNPSPLTSLQAQTVVQMTSPVVNGTDPTLQKTDCAGQLALMLPPSVTKAFGGSNMLSAPIQYSVQPAADHSGPAVSVSGADPVAQQLATATDNVSHKAGTAGTGAASGLAAFSSGSTGDSGGATVFAGKTYNPSFPCAGNLTNAMRMICQDENLSQLDRQMASVYKQLRAKAPKDQLPDIIAGQKGFLRDRDACADTDCMTSAYQNQIETINGMLSSAGDGPE